MGVKVPTVSMPGHVAVTTGIRPYPRCHKRGSHSTETITWLHCQTLFASSVQKLLMRFEHR